MKTVHLVIVDCEFCAVEDTTLGALPLVMSNFMFPISFQECRNFVLRVDITEFFYKCALRGYE